MKAESSMPPEARNMGSAGEWLRRAKSNFALAKQRWSEEIYYEDLCFETQQAVEKALKAVLLSKGIKFRFIRLKRTSSHEAP
jgi:HEPN domain-containing protein